MSVTPDPRSDIFWKVRADARSSDVRAAKKAGIFPCFAPLAGSVGREAVVDGCRVLMFGSNNYLGLADDPRVVEAATAAVRKFGTGCTGSRLMNGTLDIHLELEQELADLTGRDGAIVYTAGYLANLGVISAMCDPDDVLVGDSHNHASITDGCSLAGVTKVTVRHNDVRQLGAKLARLRADGRRVLVTWDSIFSMSGDVAPVAEIVATAREHGARTFIDEAHSIGVLGPEGGGVSRMLDPQPDLVMGTFSKSFASCGGFIVGDAEVIDYLRLASRPFLFTAAGTPASVGAALEAVRICRTEPWRIEQTLRLARMLADGLRSMGLDVTHGDAAIVSVGARDEWKALLAWRQLMDDGVYVNVGIYPAVSQGDALLRLSTMSVHTDADITRCLEAFEGVCGWL